MLNSRKRILVRNGVVTDSLVLTFVKVVTALLGMAVTKLLSIKLSLLDYGTYSQAYMISNTVASISILGLTDATMFFFNKSNTDEEKEQFVATIFGVQYIIGFFAALMICFLRLQITKFFQNERLYSIIPIIALFPLFYNILAMLQVLFVSTGRAKTIAIRNLITSLARLLFVCIACFITNKLETVFVLLLVMDFLQILYFQLVLHKAGINIRFNSFNAHLLHSIFQYAIPLFIYISTSSFLKDLDKYIIGFYSGTETLALYSNASRNLPFDIISLSFVTVLMPIITRQINSSNYTVVHKAIKSYIRVGYLTTCPLVAAAIVNARELMLFFYDEKYLAALPVFIIYLFVDYIKFFNIYFVLVAKGRNALLMFISIASLVINFGLDIVLYSFLGIVGPAIATLVVSLLLNFTFLVFSSKCMNKTATQLFDFKDFLSVTGGIVLLSLFVYLLRYILFSRIKSFVLLLIVCYGLFVAFYFLLFRKRIMDCLRSINSLK